MSPEKIAMLIGLFNEPWGEVLQDRAMSFVLFGIVFVYFATGLIWLSMRAGR